LNDRAGAKTPVASLVTGIAILLTLLLLAPLFSALPKAILGAVVIEAVTLGMMDVPELRRLYAVKRSDFWIAIAALIGVVLLGVLAGVLIGVLLSLIWLLRVVTSPSIPLLGRVKGSHVFRDLDIFLDDEQIPGVLAVRPEGALFFATADSLEDRIHTLVDQSDEPIEVVILDCQSVSFIDAQGTEKVRGINRYLAASNIAFSMSRVKSGVLDVLERDGVVAEIGPEHFYLDVNDAVNAYLSR
jgi:MFS superfamily sulfate permease-like transporter